MSDQFVVNKTPVAGLPTQKSFNIDYYSKQEARSFSGLFVVKRPTIMDQARIEAEKSKVLGGRYHDADNPGVGVPGFADNIAEAVSYLNVVIVDAPNWWNGGDLYDAELLFRIYEEARNLDPFRREEGESVADRAHGKDSNQQHNDTDAGSLLKDVVDEEVPLPDFER